MVTNVVDMSFMAACRYISLHVTWKRNFAFRASTACFITYVSFT